jgi:hypothetical protein
MKPMGAMGIMDKRCCGLVGRPCDLCIMKGRQARLPSKSLHPRDFAVKEPSTQHRANYQKGEGLRGKRQPCLKRGAGP